MPFSVLKSSGAAVGGPRNQPARPGFPAEDVEMTSLTRIWKFAHTKRRVAPQAVPAGRRWSFSGGPSASMRRFRTFAALSVPNLIAPTPSAARRILSLEKGTLVVVAAVDVV